MSQVPPGYIFDPSEQVLLLDYLRRKVNGEPLPCPHAVKEIDLYQMSPDDIWNKFKEGPPSGNSDLFCFTKLRSTGEQSKFGRTVNGGGKWKQEGGGEEVYSDHTNRSSIGFKRRFSFISGEPPQRSGWVMYEYRLGLPSSPPSPYVVCRLHKNRANCQKRKEQSELEALHTEAVNQPITLVPKSEHRQGVIDISESLSQRHPQLQDNPTDLGLPSEFCQWFLSTTNSAHEQDESETSGACFQSQHRDIFSTEINGAQSRL